ncbi:MAG: hypothetical protein H6674_02470 [Dehalococcoidia bacterium]|nr:hypothetical protein [Dehalococcoidia bacterium]
MLSFLADVGAGTELGEDEVVQDGSVMLAPPAASLWTTRSMKAAEGGRPSAAAADAILIDLAHPLSLYNQRAIEAHAARSATPGMIWQDRLVLCSCGSP